MKVRGLVYLHGFASSPRSSKARYFADRAAEAGLAFVCPDLNLPDFHSLTVTRMLDQADAAIDSLEAPVGLVGSSLGAFVALHAAARRMRRGDTRIGSLVFLAPAFDLVSSLDQEFGPERMRQWEQSDRHEVFHYGDAVARDLGWGFMADARKYDAFAVDVPVPTLIFQGTHDDVVAPEAVRRWAAGRPSVTLRMVDDSHQLLDHLAVIWRGTASLFESEP